VAQAYAATGPSGAGVRGVSSDRLTRTTPSEAGASRDGGAPLDICIVAPPSLRIPPFHGYGGAQRGIHDLCEVLHARGHRVTLCGPGDSTVTAVDRLIAPLPHALWEDDSPTPREEREALARRYADEVAATLARERFDLVNLRYDDGALLEAVALQDRAPVLYSCHNPASARYADVAARLAAAGRLYSNAHNRSHRAQYANVPGMHVVPYGMHVAAYRFRPAPLSGWTEPPALPLLRRLWDERRDYLVFIGRMGPKKAPASAIRIARGAGLPLVLCGAPENRNHPTVEYFEREVLPHVDDRDVFYFGVCNEAQKQELLGGARAALFTTGLEVPTWREPHARVIMEALACGTPLVAHPHGCAEEIITEDVAVFGRSVDELARAAAEVGRLDRHACRTYAEHHFSRERMGAAYEALYRALIADWARRRGEGG
jgi:glycosyltransferase involved in cell wall biosynthesis